MPKKIELDTIYNESCLETLKKIPNDFDISIYKSYEDLISFDDDFLMMIFDEDYYFY